MTGDKWTKVNFDDRGYLIPYEVIDIRWHELEEWFVFSHVRASIFIEFRRLLAELTNEGIDSFHIWIGGSFASTKPSPNDMDLVFFIDHCQYYENQAKLISLRHKFSLLDIYFVNFYPSDHPKHFLTNFDQLDWLHFFTRDRSNNRKGILKITVSDETLRSTSD